jgi:hypothetical protein
MSFDTVQRTFPALIRVSKIVQDNSGILTVVCVDIYMIQVIRRDQVQMFLLMLDTNDPACMAFVDEDRHGPNNQCLRETVVAYPEHKMSAISKEYM